MDIGGKDGATTGDLTANQFRLEVFAFGDELHLLGDQALASQVHLRHVSVAVSGSCLRFSLLNPAVAQCHDEHPANRRPWPVKKNEIGLWHRVREAATSARQGVNPCEAVT